MTDRFALMLLWLRGHPAPALPSLPGRVYSSPMKASVADPGLRDIDAAAVWAELARQCDPDLRQAAE